MIFEQQDHLHALKAAGLVEEFAWVDSTWHVRLPATDLTPKTTAHLGDDDLSVFALAMVHGALMAKRLTEEQFEEVQYYAQDA